MQLLSGVNHVAIVTQNLDRFVDFYTNTFGAEVVFHDPNPPLRHAILRTGVDSWLHPAEISDSPHASAHPKMFQRGHLDHIALTAASRETFETLRQRLIESGASDGAIEDLGAFRAMWFEDPDGMRGELVVIVDPALKDIHEPRPYGPPSSSGSSSSM